MRLEIRTERMQFLATRAPEPKTDMEGRQKKDQRTQELLWQTELVALEVAPGQYVQGGELVATPWAMGDRSGVAYRAATLAAARSTRTAAAS